VIGGVALVHAEEVAREQRRFVAAGAGTNFEDGALLVGGILWQQRDLQGARQLFEPLLARALLFLGEGAHLGVERGVAEHGGDAVELGRLGAVLADRRRHRLEAGQLARQRDEGRGVGIGGEAAVDLVVPAQDEVELVLGELHGALEVAKPRARYNPRVPGRGLTAGNL
jgi:hypothetical protein